MKREVFAWEMIASTEKGDANRLTASKSFRIPTGFYVEKDECLQQVCDATTCNSFCWKLKWNSEASERKTVLLTGELLPEFIRLSNEIEPENFARKVVGFAQKWGNLDLCSEHQMPASHNYNCEPSIPYKRVILRPIDSSNISENNQIYSEPLSGWRNYSLFAKTLLNLTTNLQEGKLGEEEDWQTLHSIGFLGWSHAEKRKEKNYQENLLQFEKMLVSDGVNQWLALGNLRPEIKWYNNNITIGFNSASSYGSLFAYLALQIMLAIGRQDGLAICSTCGIPYIPDRKPDDKKRRFCLQCRKSGKPQTLASADYRNRKKEKEI